MVVGSHDPNVNVDVKTLEIAALPDNFNEETTFKHYIAQIAMAFLSDYQDFAPLPGGNLGTSAQSEILHMKSRGRGPALWMKMITHAMNQRILPSNVEFRFDEQDLEAEAAEAETAKARAEERAARIASGEINEAVARQQALEDGDLTLEQFEELERADREAAEQAPPITVRPSEERLEEGEQPAAPEGGEPFGEEGERGAKRLRPFWYDD